MYYSEAIIKCFNHVKWRERGPSPLFCGVVFLLVLVNYALPAVTANNGRWLNIVVQYGPQ